MTTTSQPTTPAFAVQTTDEADTIAMPAQLVAQNRQHLRGVVEELLDRKDGPPVIRLDCAQLVYADSSGLGVLITLKRKAQQAGRQLVLTNFVNHDMRVLFELTKIDTLFTVEPPFER